MAGDGLIREVGRILQEIKTVGKFANRVWGPPPCLLCKPSHLPFDGFGHDDPPLDLHGVEGQMFQ